MGFSEIFRSERKRHPGPGVPFVAYGTVLRDCFGVRVQKISLNTHAGCPHRTSSGEGGCAWCRPETFLPAYCNTPMSLEEQLGKGMEFFSRKADGGLCLAYLQGYTSTLGDPDSLLASCRAFLSRPGVAGVVLSSRPDTLSPVLMDGLALLARDRFVCVELGMESCNDATLHAMHRGHDHGATVRAMEHLRSRGILTGGHLIFGLPGDSAEDQVSWAEEISRLGPDFLKIHHLQIMEGTELHRRWREDPEATGAGLRDAPGHRETCISFLERLDPRVVMERFTNEAPESHVIAPRWGGIKNQAFANDLSNVMKSRDTWQGRLHGKA